MLFSRMIGGLGNQLFQAAAFLKYRSSNEKVIISFLGNIHIPKYNYCLNDIFEKPNWLFFDNSKNLSPLTKLIAQSSATLRFGSYLPLIGINDRNFFKKDIYYRHKKVLFFDGYFQNWDYEELYQLFSQLKIKSVILNKEDLKTCNEDVLIHIRGGDFLNIKHLNICKFDYYKKSINYFLSKGLNNFKVLTADHIYGQELIKKLKEYFSGLQISIIQSGSIKNDFNLVRSSKLAILSNSTFSWWASFLSNSKKEFLVPSNFSTKEKRIVLPNETIIK